MTTEQVTEIVRALGRLQDHYSIRANEAKAKGDKEYAEFVDGMSFGIQKAKVAIYEMFTGESFYTSDALTEVEQHLVNIARGNAEPGATIPKEKG